MENEHERRKIRTKLFNNLVDDDDDDDVDDDTSAPMAMAMAMAIL